MLSLFMSSANAVEILCPASENEPWDKMYESEFTKKKVKHQLTKLQEYFDGEIIVAEEFIAQSLIIIEGGALRQSIEHWKKQQNHKNEKYWTYKFCKFMSKRAYLVH